MSAPRSLGEYAIEGEIGRGGFGIVYRAQQTSLDRPVALKVLYKHLVGTQDQVNRFEREARAAARLDHPALVTVYAWGREDDDFYIAEKLVGDGRTLADMLDEIRAGGEPPKGYFRRMAELTTVVADGLQHAHARGVVHRDIKPSNILLDHDGQVLVGDFGLAKIEDGLELSRTGDFVGSPFYMAPEQAESGRGVIDARTDVYSLGVTLYELLTRTQPFLGKSAHEIIRRILNDEPEAPHKIDPRVPRDLETICLKALEKSPERRYASTADMAADLRAFLDGEPIGATPIGSLTRTTRFLHRKRQVVGIVVLAALLVLTGVYSWKKIGELSEQGRERDRIAQLQREGEEAVSPVVEQIESVDEERARFEQRNRAELDAAIADGDLERARELQDSYNETVDELATQRKALTSQAIDTFNNWKDRAAEATSDVAPSFDLASLVPDGLFGGAIDLITPAVAQSGSPEDDALSQEQVLWLSFSMDRVILIRMPPPMSGGSVRPSAPVPAATNPPPPTRAASSPRAPPPPP